MHTFPSYPKRPLVTGLAALFAFLAFAAASAPDLDRADFSTGAGSFSPAPARQQPAVHRAATSAKPPQTAWATDPLRSPLYALAGR